MWHDHPLSNVFIKQEAWNSLPTMIDSAGKGPFNTSDNKTIRPSLTPYQLQNSTDFSPSIILGNFKGVNFAFLNNKQFVPGCDVST